MIAGDTSSLVAFFQGEDTKDANLIGQFLLSHTLMLPPVVQSELYSDPTLSVRMSQLIVMLPLLEIKDGFWQRSGVLRASLFKRKCKARLPDILIAQSCIDHQVSLITRDTDFKQLAKHSDLVLR